MLVPITHEKAFELLMADETRKTVYFKNVEGYQRAEDYKWVFSGRGGVNITKTEFYKEEEQTSPRKSLS